MGEFAIGQGVPRFEDPRLLRGGGKYVDDIVLPGMAFGHVLRSPHAHAKIKSIDTAKAKAAPGVLCVLTGEDWIKSGWGDLPVPGTHKRRDGSTNYKPRYPALVKDRVRFVGDYVAFVVAETKNQAMDAAELIEVDYEPLPATIATADAAKPGATLVWDDCKDNICFTAIHGDKAKTEAAFANAAHVVKEHLVINRVTTASMEPRGSVGDYNAIEDQLHDLHHLAARASLSRRARQARAEGARAQGARGRPRHRRQLRHEVGDLQRGAARAAGVEEDRPAGEMDEHALGGVPLRRAGARQRHRRRARARQGRHLPRLPRHRRPSTPAPICNPASRPTPAISARSPASTGRRRCMWSRRRCSPTPSRCGPIAATAGRRRPT